MIEKKILQTSRNLERALRQNGSTKVVQALMDENRSTDQIS